MKRLVFSLLLAVAAQAAPYTNVTIGTAGAGQGDSLNRAFQKLNWTDNYLYTAQTNYPATETALAPYRSNQFTVVVLPDWNAAVGGTNLGPVVFNAMADKILAERTNLNIIAAASVGDMAGTGGLTDYGYTTNLTYRL